MYNHYSANPEFVNACGSSLYLWALADGALPEMHGYAPKKK